MAIDTRKNLSKVLTFIASIITVVIIINSTKTENGRITLFEEKYFNQKNITLVEKPILRCLPILRISIIQSRAQRVSYF